MLNAPGVSDPAFLFLYRNSGFYVPFDYGQDVPRPGVVISIGAMMALDASQPPIV
jgi:hypothetical protein